MTEEKAVAKFEKPDTLSLSQMRLLATDFAKSKYFQDALAMEQAVVKIQAGAELGFPPVYSMTKIFIVQGHVSVSAEAMGAMIKRSGRYDYKPGKYTDTEVEIIFTDGGKDCFTSRFTMEDAEKAKLVKADSGWLKWPRAMLWSKALSQGARIVCPHVIAGVYTPEDFGLETNEAGEPLKVTITPEPELARRTPARQGLAGGALAGEARGEEEAATIPEEKDISQQVSYAYGNTTWVSIFPAVSNLRESVPEHKNGKLLLAEMKRLGATELTRGLVMAFDSLSEDGKQAFQDYVKEALPKKE